MLFLTEARPLRMLSIISMFVMQDLYPNTTVIANQSADWCGNPFSLSPYERHGPKGHLCACGTRKPTACRGYGLPHQCEHWFAMTRTGDSYPNPSTSQ